MTSPDRQVLFETTNTATTVTEEPEILTVRLPEPVINDIVGRLEQKAGTVLFEGITIEVLQSEIRDAVGNVVDRIG